MHRPLFAATFGKRLRKDRITKDLIVLDSTALAVERAGFKARDIEIDIFLVDLFVAVHAIHFGVVKHGVVPIIQDRKTLV